jgi:ketosteroid isomerase-like protein
MGIEENKRTILGFFENLSAGNGDAVLGALADSATWWIQGNFPLSGTKSKKEFAAVVAELGSKIDGGLRVTPKGITAEGERVAVVAESFAKMKNGKSYHNTYHFLFTVRDGKIQSVM